MKIETKELNEQFLNLNNRLKIIATMADAIAIDLFKTDLTVTSIWRKKTTDSGLHELYRAIDFRCLQPMEYTYRLIDIINHIWIYDPNRPTLKVAHENPYHGTAPHIHLQVHPNTVSLTLKQVEEYATRREIQERNFKPQKL